MRPAYTLDPTDALLATAMANLQSRLEAFIGPVDAFIEETDEGTPYIGFAQPSTSRCVIVAPSESGGWTCCGRAVVT